MIIAHLADIHLGRRQYGLEERMEDYNKAFLRAVDLLLEIREKRGLDCVLISGDFFDTQRPQPSIYLTAVRGLMRLRDAGIPVLTIRGNHDASVANPGENPLVVLHQMGLVRYLDGGYVDLGDVRVVGIGTVYSEDQGKLLASLGRLVRSGVINIAMLHQYVEGVPYRYSMPNMDVFAISDKPLGEVGIDYYALGHIHSHETKHPRLETYYPGSLEIWDVGEFETYEGDGGDLRFIKPMDPKGFLLLHIGDKVRVESIRLPHSRRMVRLRLRYSEVNPSALRRDVEYLSSRFDLTNSYVFLEIEGKLLSGYSTRDIDARGLRGLFSKARLELRLNLSREEGRSRGPPVGGINDIIKAALMERLGGDREELIKGLLGMLDSVEGDDEENAWSILERILGVNLRGSLRGS